MIMLYEAKTTEAVVGGIKPNQPNKWRTIMTKVGEVYKCEICGNVVEVKKAGEGELVCCGEPMKKQQVKS